MMDIWEIVQECVVSMAVKKSTTNCFIKLEVFCQMVAVREWEVKRRKSYPQLINRMTQQMKVVMAMRGSQKIKESTELPFK